MRMTVSFDTVKTLTFEEKNMYCIMFCFALTGSYLMQHDIIAETHIGLRIFDLSRIGSHVG